MLRRLSETWSLLPLLSSTTLKQSRESHKLNFRFYAKLAERKSKTYQRGQNQFLHTISFRYHWLWFPIKSAFLNGSANPANTTKDRHQPTQESNKNSLNYGTPFFLIFYPSLAIKPDAQVWSSIRITDWKYVIHIFWEDFDNKVKFSSVFVSNFSTVNFASKKQKLTVSNRQKRSNEQS